MGTHLKLTDNPPTGSRFEKCRLKCTSVCPISKRILSRKLQSFTVTKNAISFTEVYQKGTEGVQKKGNQRGTKFFSLEKGGRGKSVAL